MKDARVDAYVEGAGEFARPVLRHVRELMHRAGGEVEETIKWSRPFFLCRGQIVANMAAFKAHCSVGLWGSETKAPDAEAGDGLRQLRCLEDLPPDEVLLEQFGRAFALAAAAGTAERKASPVRKERGAKVEPGAPKDLAEALAGMAGAAERFAALSPSCRREYVEWIESAKRPETRARRVAEAAGWIAEGKRRHWKYEGSGGEAAGSESRAT